MAGSDERYQWVQHLRACMALSGFYIRFRGRVSGPFELASLQAMVRRGTLSRIHELSADGERWTSAESRPELFAQIPGQAPAAVSEPPARAAAAGADGCAGAEIFLSAGGADLWAGPAADSSEAGRNRKAPAGGGGLAAGR